MDVDVEISENRKFLEFKTFQFLYSQKVFENVKGNIENTGHL
jgi:hypothetical protein